MKYLFLAIITLACYPSFSQSVGINTDGLPPTDPKAMLEINKAGFSKLRISSKGYSDSSLLELSNLNNFSQGTSVQMSLNREVGILFSSQSDQSSRQQDSMFSMKFSGGRVIFGMNIKNPTSVLHLHDHTSTIAGLRITNNTTGVIGNQGLYLSMNGLNGSLVNSEAGSLNFGTSNFVWGGFTSAGNFGVGTISPTEKLGIFGNVIMSNSNKGVILDGQDRPFITRGFDAFTSGNYSGLGRWGLFMEPSTLTFGIPDLPGKGFAFSKYSVNSVPQKVLTITNDGEINKPSTGSANMLPLAYGNVAANGTILNGTGNFTVSVVTTRIYDITVTGETLTDYNTTALLTVTSDGQGALGHWVWYFNGKMRVFISTTTDFYPRNFSFMLFKP